MLLKTIRTLSAAALITALCSFSAWALDLNEAKAKGLVGEVNSGYLGAVKASSDVQALVDDINEKRRNYYQKIAAKNGISLRAVEVRAGQKAIEKTAKGGLINTGEGWEKK
ncbi:MAG: YdbL family protein [Halioglobus sp.]